MSKKKIVGIVLLVPIIGFFVLVAIGASVTSYDHCWELAQQSSQSNTAAQRFFESDCSENVDAWLNEDHPAKYKFEQLAAEKENLKEIEK